MTTGQKNVGAGKRLRGMERHVRDIEDPAARVLVGEMLRELDRLRARLAVLEAPGGGECATVVRWYHGLEVADQKGILGVARSELADRDAPADDGKGSPARDRVSGGSLDGDENAGAL